MTVLIVDFSPIMYGNFISASSEMKKNGLKHNTEGKLDLDAPGYREIIKFKIFEELTSLKSQFAADKIVIAADNSKGGYWRKDVYPIYKGQRKAAREESELEWNRVFEVFDEIKFQLDEHSQFKLINIPRVEGDDVMFVLSEYLSLQNHKVILHSLDHDTVYNLRHKNVQWWRHVKSARKPGAYQEANPGEILNLELEHVIQGDGGDNIKNIKSFSKFSPKFKELYPNKCEIELYDKRFEIDDLFEKKYGESAYKHPRYGLKMFLKSPQTLDELLAENPIYEKNYMLNREIALPEGIPTEISQRIIEAYEEPIKSDRKTLMEYFKTNGMFELTSKISFI